MVSKMKGGHGFMDNKVITVILVVAIMAIGGYLFFGGSGAATVSAVGSGSLEVQPDEVSIYLNIEGKGLDAEAAKAEFDAIKDELTFSLIKEGFDREDLKSQGFRIHEEYDWSNEGREFIGYVASESIVVETGDFDSVADVVDAAIDSGALVSWINFELSDERQKDLKAEALEEASKDAKNKAEATARGLGKNLGSVVSVQSEDYGYSPYRYYDIASASEDGTQRSGVQEAAINLDPKDVTVRASVRVEYKLSSF